MFDKKNIQDHLIVRCRAGSHAYGTNIATSDLDFRGIFCAPEICIRTPFFNIKELEIVEEEDTKYYELTHYLKLALQNNPNILEVIFCDEQDVVYKTYAYDVLRDARYKLLTRNIANTYLGYAYDQLKRMKSHYKWINNPQSITPPSPVDYVKLIQWFGKDKLLPRDFDLTSFHIDHILVPYGSDLLGLYYYPEYRTYSNSDDVQNLIINNDVDREILPSPLAFLKWSREEYETAKIAHAQYWEWKNNRNVERSALEEQYHYDTKNALHLVRLLRTGAEALRDGEINVRRADAQELLDIRNGKWTYKELISYAEGMRQMINGLVKNSPLPEHPDKQFAANLLMSLQDICWQ